MVRKFFFLAATTAVVSANAQNFIVDGHEAVDLGLSVLWATCNVGAENPEDAGDYFAWGETTTKTIFTTDNHIASDWTQDLDADHDAATQNWGEKWRMPTNEEFEELKNNCDKTLDNEKKGIELKSRKNENSIFLPAAGYFHDNILDKKNKNGYYWSRSISNDNSDYAYYFNYLSATKLYINYNSRFYGMPVRAVCEKSAVTKLNYVEKQNANTVYKTFENGQIVIVKNDVKYNLSGQKL